MPWMYLISWRVRMIRYILKIELLSDLCCGTGEGDGIGQDISSTYSKDGFPIIYGRRLKGLLRDKVEFLQRKGYFTNNMASSIFGTGYLKGKIKVGNAQLYNIKKLKDEIKNLPKDLASMTSVAAVKEVYTTNRYATAIEDGVAKEHSFRVIGMFPKGLEFGALLEMDFESNSVEFNAIEDACKLLRNIGLGRNRGHGEVRCTLLPYSESTDYEAIKLSDKETDKFSYVIKNESNLILKNGYILGSAIQAYFAKRVSDNDYGISVDALLKNVKFSMAYPTDASEREAFPMPLSMMSEKGNTDILFSLADGYKIKTDVQYVRNSGYYRVTDENKLYKIDVDTTVNYHFVKNKKLLYTQKCVSDEHYFIGHIYATKEYISILAKIINDNHGVIYLGGATGAEHGKCSMNKIPCDLRDINNNNVENSRVVFELLSDAVVIDKFGCNRVDIDVLKEVVKDIVKCNTDDIKDIYTDTVEVGGYNSKWGMPRQNYIAFAKGTQIVLEPKAAETGEGFIGILNNEGYGKYRVRKADSTIYKLCKVETNIVNANNTDINIDKTGVLHKILLNNKVNEVECYAISVAEEYLSKNKQITSSTAMRLSVAYKACEMKQNKVKEFQRYISANFKGDSNKVIYDFADNSVAEFKKYKEGSAYVQALVDCDDILFNAYMRKYIFAVKMYFREREV